MNYLRKIFMSRPSPAKVLSVTMLSLVCWLPLSATAAPEISRASGIEGIGFDVTISGSAFGGKNSSFNLQDNANQYTYTNGYQVLSEPSQDSLWGEKGSPWASPFITKKEDATGNYFYFGEDKSHNDWIVPLQGQTNNSIYVSWFFNPSESLSAAGGSNKVIRIWDHSSGNSTRISWTQMHMTYSVPDIGYSPSPSWSHWGGQENTWNHLEIWVDAATGVIEARTNGKLIHDISDFKKSPIDDGLDIRLIGFDPSVTKPYAALTFMIDDMYVSTSRARVVVSESATWDAARANGKPQLIKSWSNEKISFELQPRPGQQVKELYLFVVDSNGEANSQGFPLCPQCPNPPVVLMQ
jgi:hypothetical protein